MQIRRTTTVQNTNAINLKSQAKPASVPTESSIPMDHLDISAEARAIRGSGDIRADKVADVRQQIAAGRYETTEKIGIAVERMLDEIA